MFRKYLVTFAVGVLAAVTAWRLPVVRTPDSIEKLDRALRDAVQRGRPEPLRVLITTQRETTARVRERLSALGATASAVPYSPDLIVASNLSAPALADFAADPDVLRVSSDAPVRSFATLDLTRNTLLGTEGLLTKSGSISVRSNPYTGRNIGVAVVDSGFVTSADLDGVTASYTFLSGTAVKQGPKDAFGHGTHVSGLIGSSGSTSGGTYQGLAPDVRFIVLKALDDNGSGYTSNVIAAINFAVTNKKTFGIDVLNLSLGHPLYEPAATDPLVQAVEKAAAAGIVVVVSAGNFGGDPDTHEVGYGGITSPGNAPDAITVGAVETLQTNGRGDDTVAWYSSRGPTWYDGFQKPDIVAPGSHLVSDVSSGSVLATQYPGGIIPTSGTCDLMRLSGTSMSAGVVSGIVAAMLDANRTKHPGAVLTPNAVKAILQYTALPLANYDTLTQGAGAVNAAGAIELAAAVDPTLSVGSWWLTTGVNTYTTIAGQSLPWGQSVVWGDRVIWGHQIYYNDPAFALRVVWGNQAVWGNRVIWGHSTVWDDSNQLTWGNRVIWGHSLIGETTSSGTSWGGLDSTATASRVVWGNLQSLNIAPTSISWGNLERSNMDIK